MIDGHIGTSEKLRTVRGIVAEWTGTHAYTIDQVLQDMIDRCRELKLRLATSPAKAISSSCQVRAAPTCS